MNEAHRKKLGIPDGHRIVQRDVKSVEDHGRMSDVYWYDEIDKSGRLVQSHVLTIGSDAASGGDNAGSLAWKFSHSA